MAVNAEWLRRAVELVFRTMDTRLVTEEDAVARVAAAYRIPLVTLRAAIKQEKLNREFRG